REEVAPEGALTAVRGSGGFPLLGSTLFSAAPREADGAPPALTLATAAEVRDGRPTLHDVDADSGERRPGRRVSVAAGLAVALAFVSGLALPDLTDPTRAGLAPWSQLRRLIRRVRA